MTRVELYSLAGREDAETVAVWEDGGWVEGADAVGGVYPDGPPETAEGVREQAAGPGLFATDEPGGGTADKAWVPYIGPDGGEGWEDADTGRVVYEDEPPGEARVSEEQAAGLFERALESTDPSEIGSRFSTVPDHVEDAFDISRRFSNDEIDQSGFESEVRSWVEQHFGVEPSERASSGGGGDTDAVSGGGTAGAPPEARIEPDGFSDAYEIAKRHADSDAGPGPGASKNDPAAFEADKVLVDFATGDMTEEEVVDFVTDWMNIQPHDLSPGDTVTVDGEEATFEGTTAREGLLVDTGSGTEEIPPSEWADTDVRDDKNRKVSGTLDVPDDATDNEERVMRAIGTDRVDLEGLEDGVAEATAERIAQLSDQGHTRTVNIVSTDPDMALGDTSGTIASYSPNGGALVIDPNSYHPGTFDRGGTDHTVTEGPEDVITHEIGHAMAYYADADVGLPLEPEHKDVIRDYVSEYAATDSDEMMAEVYTMKQRGDDVPAIVDEVYRMYGGPEVTNE